MSASPRLDRAAVVLFVAHAGLVVFSTVAMLTILNGPPSPFLAREPNATIMRIAWTWSGPTYVVLGALAALAHAAARLGLAKAAAIAATAISVSLAAELIGTSSGLPFGDYRYSGLLGYRIAGLVPFPIPISWFYMIYCCLALAGRRLHGDDGGRSRWNWALVAGLFLVAWDVSMDPAMVSTAHWMWGGPDAFRSLGFPEFVTTFFTRDVFYGMPLGNWFGWLLTGTLIARLLVSIVPPSTIVRNVSPSRLPVALYATNGIMPVAICLRDGLWWAAVFGAAAMAVPVLLALRPPRQRLAADVRGEHVRVPG
ncbi:MAG: carotenoid biosynthesis protein [Gemmatimonadota bacterium]